MINKLQKEYNLVETVVNDFDRYMREVAIICKGLQEKAHLPSDKQNHV